MFVSDLVASLDEKDLVVVYLDEHCQKSVQFMVGDCKKEDEYWEVANREVKGYSMRDYPKMWSLKYKKQIEKWVFIWTN